MLSFFYDMAINCHYLLYSHLQSFHRYAFYRMKDNFLLTTFNTIVGQLYITSIIYCYATFVILIRNNRIIANNHIFMQFC